MRVYEVDQEEEQQVRQKNVKRRVAISRYICSVNIGKNKGIVIKAKNERPTDPEERKTFRYLCPICFRYFNEILECTHCENYLCMYCARDLIKFELKRTKQLVPLPPEDELQIACPHCLELSVTGECLFRDVVKSKPAKIYTDSPSGTLILCAPMVGGDRITSLGE
jgi:hypothetical protein